VLERERAAGLDRPAIYREFGERARECRAALLDFLERAEAAGESVAGYGAAAKASTLLNYAGVGAPRIAFTADRSPHKQGRLLPGTGIPIVSPKQVAEAKPDYLLIFAWNLTEEITRQMSFIEDWGGRFVSLVPRARVLPSARGARV
jgi:hypothetical protein